MWFELIFSVAGNDVERYERLHGLTATDICLVAAQIAKGKDIDISEVEVRFVLIEPRLEDGVRQ